MFALMVFCLLALPHAARAAPAVETAYENIWYPAITNTTATNAWQQLGTVAYGFATELTIGSNRLYQARLGVPVGSLPANFGLGERVPPPEGWDETTPAFDFLGGPTNVVWLDYAKTLLVADQGACRVTWQLESGESQTLLYVTSPNPSKRPVRLYWTEGQYAGPPVQFGQTYEVEIHYNAQITGTNAVWIDRANMLHAARGQSGRFMLTYSRVNGDTGFRELLDWEVVEVLQPAGVRQDVFVGDRLLPVARRFDTDELFSEVIRGATDQTQQDEDGVYVYKHTQGEKLGWVWAIRDTDEPWRIEIYWKAEEALGVIWPFEDSIYQVTWNPDCQRHVTARDESDRVPVLFPDTLGVEVMPRQFPSEDHAHIDAEKRLLADGEGWCLMKYIQGKDVWFDPIRSLWNDSPEVMSGCRNWTIGDELQPVAGAAGAVYDGWPGYLCTPAGDRYHTGLYDYPATYRDAGGGSNSFIYAVNEGPLEAWWFNRSTVDLPEPVYWPSLVCCYSNVWPTNALQLVIASGLGSRGQSTIPGTNATRVGRDYGGTDPYVYVQNDAGVHGYNPNEEHALVVGDAVYALRNDLNTLDTSEPFVLVTYNDLERARPEVDVYTVLASNELYAFGRDMEAGQMIQAPMPLPLLQPAYCTSNSITGEHHEDRQGYHWAKQAGDDNGVLDLTGRFYYPMQPGFFFPFLGSSQPDPLTEVPWLSGANLDGTPTNWVYHVRWPADAPVLHVGDTLTNPKNELPAIRGQLSVDVLYQQSTTRGAALPSVKLIDPTVARKVVLDEIPPGMKTVRDPRSGNVFFSDLPPSLRTRLYYSPTDAVNLHLIGEYRERIDGHNYLLLNVLTGENREQVLDAERVRGIVGNEAWSDAIAALPTNVVELSDDETPFDSLALSAIGTGTGYVTVVFNDSTNRNMVDPSEVVDLAVIRVEAPLYRGRLDVILSDNPLDKQQTLKYTADFGGVPELYEFEWEHAEPESGMAPDEEDPSWRPFALDAGKHYAVVGDAGVFGLADHYLRCRYRALDPVVEAVVGTNFNAWTPPTLAEGWIKRVMKAITPFDQRIRDFMNYELHTQLSMIQQAGPPYSGDIPLNMEALNECGLIPVYRTILEQARDLSIDAGIDGGVAVSLALMLAAGRLSDLHMVLGNEAYGDALDPTIGLGNDDPVSEGYATRLFCFQNQMSTLLDEELALLRGRDDSLNPPVAAYPIYNRLAWNFTADIVGGQPAYVLNYGISDLKGDQNGVLDVADAHSLFPQGHGDAWGHYLSAVKCYYELLHHDYFSWFPQAEGILAGGETEITVSFLHEKKMAVAAAAKARVGAGIAERTYRQQYSAGSAAPWHCHSDSNTNRAWGVGEWGARAGMGAYFDWLTCNAVLPAQDPNGEHSGIQIIDRTTVPELGEIATQFNRIQEVVDRVDGGLNPLGLAPGAVPFDISAAGIDDGRTHFDQAYDKALTALANALDVFDRVKTCGQALRDQNENAELDETIQAEETAITAELIALYGYPYSDDIGPGKLYPQGYNGPDLVHYNYIELFDWDGESESVGRTISLTFTNRYLTGYEEGSYDRASFGGLSTLYTNYIDLASRSTYVVPTTAQVTNSVTFYVGPDGLPSKPQHYAGQRRAEGEIQIALCRYAKALKELDTAERETRRAIKGVRKTAERLYASLSMKHDNFRAWQANAALSTILKRAMSAINIGDKITSAVVNASKATVDAASELYPKSVGNPVTGSADTTSIPRSATKAGHAAVVAAAGKIQVTTTIAKEALVLVLEAVNVGLQDAQKRRELRWSEYEALLAMRSALKAHIPLLEAMQQKLQAAEAARMRYMKLVAEGDALQVERERLRMNWATDLSAKRYRNMAYRIFRDDALVRYQQMFENASRYVYLAAKAYDYETGLLASDAEHTAGRDFYNDIIRARTIGAVARNKPEVIPIVGGNIGEPGLADILGRMKENWDVLKGRLNFNNPETETGRFSLRTELFRIAPKPSSDEAWREMLERHVVDNVLELPEFKRYCLPFHPQQAAEPAIVIPFSSTIMFRENFFGQDLAAGDNAYDSSHFATKIRSVGVWFCNYENDYNTGGTGGGLANQPRVYLVPVGTDMMRVPDGTGETIRQWNVVDQALPVPYPINDEDWQRPDWNVLSDVFGGELYQTRKHGSLRAYHDSGGWSAGEVCNNARLVGRSVWNTRWMLVIPGGTLLSDAEKGIERFIHGAELAPGAWDENGVTDIKLIFQTYSYAGN